MEAVKRVFKFGMGSAFGAAIGAGIASLLAPQKGEVLQQQTRQLMADVQSAGEEARVQTEERLAQKFRGDVHDPSALTGMSTHDAPKTV